MLTPKVTEINRGSAHRREVLTVRAGRARDNDHWQARVRSAPSHGTLARSAMSAIAA
jgi:hypothetical protein